MLTIRNFKNGLIKAVLIAAGTLWAVCFTPAARAATEPITVVQHYFVDDANNDVLDYRGEVLKLLLEKSRAKYGDYRLESFYPKEWNQVRAFRQLEAGDLDIVAAATDTEREKVSLPIRYCLYRGLLGVRIGVGSERNVTALNALQSREALQKVTLGQVFDWPDYRIQKAAGLQVERLPDLKSGLVRLRRGSFQLLPLGAVEVAPFVRDAQLAAISTWALVYPSAYYFFVSKTRPELAERLRYGFEQALKDQSFLALFSQKFAPMLELLALEKRTLFFLDNPYLPVETPLGRQELWHPMLTANRP